MQGGESNILDEDTDFVLKGYTCKAERETGECVDKRKRAGVGWTILCQIAMKFCF